MGILKISIIIILIMIASIAFFLFGQHWFALLIGSLSSLAIIILFFIPWQKSIITVIRDYLYLYKQNRKKWDNEDKDFEDILKEQFKDEE